jgi:phi13 family phage major tail protein
MGKVIYGLKEVHYSIYTPGENGAAGTYGPWKRIPGAVSLSADADTTQNDFYADDGVYATLSASGKETGTIEFAAITAEMYADLFGYATDSTSGLAYQNTEPVGTTFALGYEVSGNESKMRGVRYNVTFTPPSQSANTMTDSTNPDTVSVNYTAAGRDFTIGTGTSAQTVNVLKAHCTNEGETHTAYDNFWNAVIIPGAAPTTTKP